MENDFLKVFLSNARQNLVKSDKPKWLVIGNESSDLDSVVCSLVYGYYKQMTTDRYYVIPLISIPKNRVNSKKDVNVWMNQFDINLLTDLVYLEEIIQLMDHVSFSQNLIITLVDHHKPLRSVFNEFIKEVIDHRETNYEYFPNQLEIKNIKLVASCCTLIASYILNNEDLLHKNILLKLLYGGILLDSDCLCPKNGKTTENDIVTLTKIEGILGLSIENRIEIYSTLFNAKSDVSGLSFIQQMQRDLKTIDVNWKNSSLKIAIPTVIETDVEDILSTNSIKDLLHETLTELNVSILIILTCGKESMKRRGYVLYTENSELKNKIFHFLMNESQLKLEEIKVDMQLNLVVCVENHLLTTRKIFIPLIEKFFLQESTVQYKFQSNNCNIHLRFDEIDSNSEEEIEQEGGPYTLSTPRRSCSGSPDSRNSDMNLPSLNNRRTLALIDQKRQKHKADMEVIEDEIEDNIRQVEDDESPSAYTPENTDEEENETDSEQVKKKLKPVVNIGDNTIQELLDISELDRLSTDNKNTCETNLIKISTLPKPDKWDKEIDSLSFEVDKRRQKLETNYYDSIVNAVVTDMISKSESIIKTETIYKKFLSNWSESFSDDEKNKLINTIETDDTLNMVNLLTTSLIRDCISEFELIVINPNEDRNNNAITKDIDDNQTQPSINKCNEDDDEFSDESLPDSTIPDLEINYNSCPVDTIINKDVQGISNCGNPSGFDIENSSFNLYRRISSNQLDFTEDEKKLFAVAGNWYPDEDTIYSDCEQEPIQVLDNEKEIDVSKKIIYPSKEITMNLTNLETNTSTEISLNDLDLIPTPDLNMVDTNIETNDRFQSDIQDFDGESKSLIDNCEKNYCEGPDGDKIFEKYDTIMCNAGYYFDATNDNKQTKIITISNCYFPERSNENYHKIMQYLLNSMVIFLENMDTEFYTLVYFHCKGNRKTPSLIWLYQSYKTINYKLKKNLKHFYIVHPTIWLRAFGFLCRVFINSKFYKKIEYLSKLHELHDCVPTSNICFPAEVLRCDSSL